MKRRTLATTLAISMLALPVFAQPARAAARCNSLEHVQGAWQMLITCEEGDGTISLVDDHGANAYRGTGAFSKWSQDQLRAMYESLLPGDDIRGFESMQLG